VRAPHPGQCTHTQTCPTTLTREMRICQIKTCPCVWGADEGRECGPPFSLLVLIHSSIHSSPCNERMPKVLIS
jgi:hypothetical protein